MRRIHKKRTLALIMAMILALTYNLYYFGQLYEISVFAATEATVNGDQVNVRTGPGTSNAVLTDSNGARIQLYTGHKVSIEDKAMAADGAQWYKIRFDYNGASYEGYMHGSYVTIDSTNEDIDPDTDFEAYLNAQGFPETYKDSLRQLHAKYPSWVFKADHLPYDFNEAVKEESIVGRSLIAYNSISSWKSLETGSYDWNTGTWYSFDGSAWAAASKELVAYCMDPRNFLDETYIFQFEALSYDAGLHTRDGVEKLISGSFMRDAVVENNQPYADAFIEAARQSGVSPYHLAARVIQEMGINGESGSISGTYAGYEGIYNYYNQGAYVHDGRSAIENGLIYAMTPDEYSLRPWNTRINAMIGGAKIIGKNYISIGQDTLYYQKFDFVGTPYTHQYMTHILAPSSEAINMSKAYTQDMKNQMTIVFKIPVYNNMPQKTAQKPTSDGSPNNVLKSITVSGYSLTPTFSKFTQEYDVIVNNDVKMIDISAQAMVSGTSVSGAGTYGILVGNNKIEIKVTAENGASRIYTINVVRLDESGSNTGKNNIPIIQESEQKASVSSDILKIDDGSKKITAVTPGKTCDEIKSQIKLSAGYTMKIVKPDNNENTGTIATGNKLWVTDSAGNIVLEYTFVVYGDVTGDGIVNSLDMLYIKRHILGISTLTGAYLEAGDTNRANDGINSLDMLYLKRHILGIKTIHQ